MEVLPLGMLGAGCVWGWGAQSLLKALVLSLMGVQSSLWHWGWEETFPWDFLVGAVFVSAQVRTEEFPIPKGYRGVLRPQFRKFNTPQI